MKITVLTLFPEMFKGPFDISILKKAQEKGFLEIEIVNIRDFGIGTHKVVDDTPYGGGIGMVMRVDVLYEAIRYTKKNSSHKKQKVILLSATGKTFNQPKAKEFSTFGHLILVCGHYEGVDERIKEYIDEEVSIGDFVLTGGELPAMLVIDTVSRLITGVLKEGATDEESFSYVSNYLEYPHYTKPRIYKEKEVPEVLLSGDHKKITEWRKQSALEKTKKVRPDLLED